MGLGLDPRALPFAKCVTGRLQTLPSLISSHESHRLENTNPQFIMKIKKNLCRVLKPSDWLMSCNDLEILSHWSA